MTIASNEARARADTLGAAERSYGQEEKKRGAIFTRTSVVDFMLDLLGYVDSEPLWKKRILEPSFGGGRFVLAAVDRLIFSWRSGEASGDDSVLDGAIRAVELDSDTFLSFRDDLQLHLIAQGFGVDVASRLTNAWLLHDDFLFSPLDGLFDFVVGNPPYVRQELIEPELLARYRLKFSSMVGRSDLYVPFIERSLDLLVEGGSMSFICADAWIKNEYGRGLRSKVAGDFWLRYYVDMYGVDAFEVQVGAYPSITVIERTKSSISRVAKAESASTSHLQQLLLDLKSPTGPAKNPAVQERITLPSGSAPWLLGISATLPVIRHMEQKFPTLSEAGCRIGIGVATGFDKAFIAPFAELDVEASRKLPLATNKDVPNGQLKWTGKGIVNPYTDEGPLVDLTKFPKLEAHLERSREQLSKRHTAKSDIQKKWYKTIDRITPSLTWEPKLLIPDIKSNGDAIAFDEGTLYPHHNLYFITSQSWNLRALQALLRSGIAQLFVEAYSVKMGGGYLRFQAQNLKRIRVPHWADIADSDRAEMIAAGEEGQKIPIPMLARLYKLEAEDLSFLA